MLEDRAGGDVPNDNGPTLARRQAARGTAIGYEFEVIEKRRTKSALGYQRQRG